MKIFNKIKLFLIIIFKFIIALYKKLKIRFVFINWTLYILYKSKTFKLEVIVMLYPLIYIFGIWLNHEPLHCLGENIVEYKGPPTPQNFDPPYRYDFDRMSSKCSAGYNGTDLDTQRPLKIYRTDQQNLVQNGAHSWRDKNTVTYTTPPVDWLKTGFYINQEGKYVIAGASNEPYFNPDGTISSVHANYFKNLANAMAASRDRMDFVKEPIRTKYPFTSLHFYAKEHEAANAFNVAMNQKYARHNSEKLTNDMITWADKILKKQDLNIRRRMSLRNIT